MGLRSGECREDKGDEDTQPPPTTTRTNHHQRDKSKGSCFFQLPTYLGSIVSITGGDTDKDVKARIGKTARQVFINLQSVWRSTLISIKREKHLHSQHQFTQVSQCLYVMVERLGDASWKAFPTNYRHT
ncbi:unnamed protein product [Heterobilharzia americana]|nr:unnamed protein product [Heterobilharzia americana]